MEEADERAGGEEKSGGQKVGSDGRGGVSAGKGEAARVECAALLAAAAGRLLLLVLVQIKRVGDEARKAAKEKKAKTESWRGG